MRNVKKIGLLTVFLSILLCCGMAFSQQTKEEFQSKIDAMQAQLKDLVSQMEEANQAGDLNAYNIAKGKYDEVNEELQTIKNEYAAQGDKEAKAKSAFNQGTSLTRSGQYQEAVNKYTEAVNMDPSNSKYYFGRAIALKKLRRYSEAETDYQKSIELNPSYSRAYFNLGILYREQEKLDRAIEVYNNALANDSTLSKAHYEIGYTYSKKKDFNNAIRAFQQATTIDPQYYKAFNALGVAYIESAKYNQAIDALKKAVTIKADHSDSYFRLSSAYNSVGNYQQALESGMLCLQFKKGNNAAAHIEMGKAYEGLGDKTNAVASYREAGKDRRYKNWVDWKLEKLNAQ